MKKTTHERIHKRFIKTVGVTTAIAVLIPTAAMGGNTATVAAATEGDATKSESVYVNVDASGKTEKETVSDWLHDDTSGAVIADQSQLSDITNIKGNEKPAISGNSVTWKLSGNDLYYQGKTNKQLPVSMTLRYFLNGKAISPSKLAGKSGRLELKISFQNNDAHEVTIDGQSKTVYTPFACLAAFDLPKKNFTNVTTNFGSVISDGSNQAVSFMGFPGLKQSFDMIDFSSVTLPDELDVTADVKDFSLGPVMMVAMPVPDMDSLKNTGSLSDLADKLNDLIDAGTQLKDATGTLNAGETSFADGVSQLLAGVNTAGASFDQIVSGADALNAAASNQQTGIPALVGGANALASGADQVSGGIDQLFSGLFGTGTAQSPTMKDSVTQYTSFSDSTLFNMVAANLKTLNYALSSDSTGNAFRTAVSQELAGMKGNADASMIQYLTASSDSDKAAYQNQTVECVTLYDALNVIYNDMLTNTVPTQANFESEMSDTNSPYLYSFDTDQNALKTNLAAASFPQTQIDALAALAQNIPAASFSAVTNAFNEKNIVISGEALAAQFKTAVSGQSATLYDQVKQLDDQAKYFDTQETAFASSASGLTSLQSGIQSLDSALGLFKNGLSGLHSGASLLNTNAKKLTDGTSALNSGMSQFWDQGLSKLQNIDAGKIKQALAVKDEMIKLADSYTSFAGSGDSITSNVKFILKTDEIKAAAAPSSSHTSAASSSKNLTFWQKIWNWVKNLFHAG